MRLALERRQFLAVDNGLLLHVGEEVAGPIHLDGRNQVTLQMVDLLDELAALEDDIEAAGILPAILVDVEVGPGGHEQGVVLGRLDVPAGGIEVLPRGQGLEDHVGGVSHHEECAAGVKKVDVLIEGFSKAARSVLPKGIFPLWNVEAIGHVRPIAVVPEVSEAEVEIREPEDLGLLELGLGHPGACLGGGDDQRPGVGQPQSRGQVDREANVAGFQRRQFQLHDFPPRRRRQLERRPLQRGLLDRPRWIHHCLTRGEQGRQGFGEALPGVAARRDRG